METAKILILGERNVGKTSFIKKMTRDSPTNKIDEIMSNELTQIGIQKAIKENILSDDAIDFMVYYGNKIFLNSISIHIPNNMVLPAIEFEESEFNHIEYIDPVNPLLDKEYQEEQIDQTDLNQYTKIILMCDFTDIGSMRSMLCFILKYKLTNKNTIICVNKCDYNTEYEDIALKRIYKVLNEFRLYPIEMISTNKEYNTEFIYKYI